MILGIAGCGRADTSRGALSGRRVADIGIRAGNAVTAAVGIVIGFAFLAILVESGVAVFELASRVDALAGAVGDDAAVAVFTAVADGVGFAGLAIDVVAGVAGSDDAGLILAGSRAVRNGAGVSV